MASRLTSPLNQTLSSLAPSVASTQTSKAVLDLNALALNVMPLNAEAYAYGPVQGCASPVAVNAMNPAGITAPEGICVTTMKRTWTSKTVFGTHRQRPKEFAL